LDSLRPALRVCLTRAVFVVAGWRDLELATDRLDAVLGPLLVDEGVHQRVKRSSSAAAKKADALRRISFARLSSRFSRSSDLSRSLSSVVSPGRSPLSTSRRRTQCLSVSDEQPIFAAMEQMAAHWDPYSSSCSRTSRTARSRTSGEKAFRPRFSFVMLQTSHRLEPPANPVRFTRRPRRPVGQRRVCLNEDFVLKAVRRSRLMETYP